MTHTPPSSSETTEANSLQDEEHLFNRRVKYIAIFLMGLVIAIYYAAIITGGDFDLFRPGKRGEIYNSLIAHLLLGRTDVDADAAGFEAMSSHGLTYVYFGILPALFRLPWALTNHLNIDPERFISWLAMLVGVSANVVVDVMTLRRISTDQARNILRLPLLSSTIFGGIAIMLAGWTSVYDEAVLCAWALAMIFIAQTLYGLKFQRHFSLPLLCAMSFVAGLCLFTRVYTAIGLYLVLAFVLLSPDNKADVSARHFLNRLKEKNFWIPVFITACFFIVAGLINYARWDNPLTFFDPHALHVLNAQHPERLMRLQRYGMFNIRRLGYGIIYYFFPIWNWPHHPLVAMQVPIWRYFDSYELPPCSFFLTSPMTLFLILAPLFFRQAIFSAREKIMAALLAMPVFMLFCMTYMAFRYRAEFYPFMVFAASIGTPALMENMVRKPARAVSRYKTALNGLCLMQIFFVHAMCLLYAFSSFGPYDSFLAEGWGSYYLNSFLRGGFNY